MKTKEYKRKLKNGFKAIDYAESNNCGCYSTYTDLANCLLSIKINKGI